MKKLINNQAVRYIFFGGCTTMVNLVSYYLLRNLFGVDITAANTIAILLAILFAYVVNKWFVFEHKAGSLSELIKEAGSFIGMRLGTMVVEVLGVLWLSCIWGLHDMIAKVAIQFVILVLNYLISKFVVFKDTDEAEEPYLKQEKVLARNYFLAGFILTSIVTGIGFAAMGIWPFGDKTVLIIDSLHQYLPFYTDFHEKLVSGESFLYSFSGGLGYNFWSTYAYYLASPLNFLMAFIPVENVCDFMDLMILLKIGLCGGCFSWYLHLRDPKRKYLPAVFGMMFALSNFVIGYYFNIMWLDSIAVLPLIMYGIEQITKGKSGRLFGISLFYALWCNYYIGFMLCIFSCLYFLVRWISRTEITWKGVWKSCLAFGWYALLAGGMAALVLMPAFMGLSTSESMQGNNFPTTMKFYENLAELLENHMAFLEPVNISSSQVGLNVYCGVSTVILAILYLFDHKIKIRERAAHLGLCALLLLSFAWNILNYIWHGFHIQNGLPNRFAFIYIAILLIMAYDALGHLRELAAVKVIVSAVIPAAFLVWRYLIPDQEIPEYVFFISIGLVMLHLGLLLTGKYMERRQWNAFCAVFAAALLIEVTANGIYGISCNGSVTRSIYLDDQREYKTMMAPQPEESFFRSEVDRQRMRNVTMYVGGNGLIMFNSTMSGAFIDLCDAIGMEARTNKNGYIGVTKLMNDVFGIKYMASPSKDADTMYQFAKIAQENGLALYKNQNALSLGFMVNEDILHWDTAAGEPLEVQNSFVELATGLEPIYVLDRYIEMEDEQNYGIKIPENKQVYLCIDTRVKKIELNTPEYEKSFSDYTDHLYVINGTPDNNMADFTVELKDTQTTVQAEVYTCENERYQEVRDALAEHQLQDVAVTGNTVSGQVETDEAGILLLTIPYDAGWEIRVDGQKTEASVIGGALTGIHLDPGTHTIKMKYTPSGLWAGSAVSLICLLLYLLSGIWEKKNPAWFMAERKGRKRGVTEMEFTFSDKAEQIQAGIFAVLNEKKLEMQAQGKKTYNLSVGTPDFKPAKHIMDAVSEAAKNPDNYKYSLIDMPELVKALQDFYKRRFDVTLEANEMMSMYGSQEGMAHIAWALCNPGDLVLVPNPGYQIFSVGPKLCEAQVYEYPLYEENGFLLNFADIPEEVAYKAKFMVVNYPANPVCALATEEFYRELIAFAKKYHIIILHDNAYSDIVFDGRTCGSFLQYEGAKEVGIEFYSLSKSFNYTGARMSFAVGNSAIIQKFKALRTQFDYGIFFPVQYGAVAALTGPFEGVLEQCKEYEARSRALSRGLTKIGWEVPDSQGTMFLWAKLPKGYHNSEQFCIELMEKTGVICVPGSSFGSLGEGYVRFALVLPVEQLEEMVESIHKSGILEK